MAKTNNNFKKQDIESNKLMLLIVLAFCAAAGLMFLYRAFTMAGHAAAAFEITFAMCVVFAVFTAGALFWRIKTVRAGVDETMRTITSSNLLRTALFCLIACLCIYRLQATAIKALYVVIPAYVAIYFMFKVYGVTMGYITSVCVANGVIFYALNRVLDYAGAKTGLYLTIFALICAGEFIICFMLRRKKNVFRAGRHDLVICSASAALPLVFLIAWFFLKTPAMRFGLFSVCAWLVLCLVYYTIDLMNH